MLLPTCTDLYSDGKQPHWISLLGMGNGCLARAQTLSTRQIRSSGAWAHGNRASAWSTALLAALAFGGDGFAQHSRLRFGSAELRRPALNRVPLPPVFESCMFSMQQEPMGFQSHSAMPMPGPGMSGAKLRAKHGTAEVT